MKRFTFTIAIVCTFALPLTGAGVAFFEGIAEQEGVNARLEALDPSRPIEYFELAEDLADLATAGDADARKQAKHLFALAAVLDRERLGRSACLALAELTEDTHERRRLLALANLLRDPRSPDIGLPAPESRSDSTANPAAVLALGEAFSFHRRGLGSRAQTALRQTGAVQLLERLNRFVGGATRFLEDIRAMRGTARPSRVNPQEIALMRVELGLLAGRDRPWSADLLLTRRESLIEINPDRLADAFGIDGTRTVYRNGVWTPPPRPRNDPRNDPDRAGRGR